MPAHRKTVDGVVRDCHCPRAHHEHGTPAAYTVDGCRCVPCTRAASDAHAEYIRRKAYGQLTPMVDAQPVRDHVQRLREYGLGLRMQATVTGVSPTIYGTLIYGTPCNGKPPTRQLRKTTADKMLSLGRTDWDRLPDTAQVHGCGTRRRVHALATLGYSTRDIADQIGVIPDNLTRTIRGARGPYVSVTTARNVRDLYERLWDRPRPVPTDEHELNAYTRTIRRAARRGWAPPLAWDDATIDDPTATPDTGATPGDTLVEDYLDLRRIEEPWLIPARLGYPSAERLRVALRRRGRDDLAAGVTHLDRTQPDRHTWKAA